jgi:hypothetical protein
MLRVSERTYQRRLARMKSLIDNKAPRIIIYHEARLIMEGWKPPLWDRFMTAFTSTRFGLWWITIMDPEWWKWKLTGKSDVYDPDFSLTPSDVKIFDSFFDTPEKVNKFLHDIINAPVVSFDTETMPLNTQACGHPLSSWYSLCSAHQYNDSNCSRCKVGRCIECYPTCTDAEGNMVFFNKEDGTRANPFPNLGKCENPDKL